MKKFSQIKYKRPDVEALLRSYDLLINEFDRAENAEQQRQIYIEVDDLTVDYNTQHALTRMRYFHDTTDEFYKGEMLFFSQKNPSVYAKYQLLQKKMLKSPFLEELTEGVGYVSVLNNRLAVKSFSPDIVPEMRRESELVLSYNNLISSLSVHFDGKDMPLSLLAPYKESTERDVRKKAHMVEGECYNSVKAELDDIFDQLVKIRTEQAKKLGFENYVELGYARMKRNCYTSDDIKLFKKQVIKTLVPTVTAIQKDRCARLGLSKLLFHDLTVSFPEGTPKPQIVGEDMIMAAKNMYRRMSPQTADFFEMMCENDLMDLYPNKGKFPGGFCSYLQKYKYPYIFANFNGTSSDVRVFTHEVGHAFAKYVSDLDGHHQFVTPTMDIGETCSMSMEFLCAPWYELFFKEQTQKYRLTHLENALIFIPYACQVDEFQEQIYKNPNLTPRQRDELWLQTEQKFRPDVSVEDIAFYSNGGGWQRQQHIYKTPFYYIDYALSQMVAFEFYLASLKDYDGAFNLYMEFLKKADTMTFTDLLKDLGLPSPLKPNTLKPLIQNLRKYIK